MATSTTTVRPPSCFCSHPPLRFTAQEHVERFVLPAFGASASKMVSGGREDADVRMLGGGRPFVLEVQGPMRGHPPAEELRAIERRMEESGW